MAIHSLETQTNLLEFITGHGYPIEVYDNITTEDGYILTAFRIPHGRTNKTNIPKPAVMLMHGLGTNSADFVIQGPTRGLSFVLSDNGYDVWLPNMRGKVGSRRHLKLNSDVDAEYWKFSFHEMGLHDLPAILNQIQAVTGLQTIAYVGHSLGTLLPLVLFSERPEFNKRFNLVINFCPVAFTPNMRSMPYKILVATFPIVKSVMATNGKFPPQSIVKCIMFLKRYTYFLETFTQFLYALHGRTPHQFIKEDLPVMLQYFPDYTSLMLLEHLRQIYRSSIFKKFDCGHQENLEKYGTADAPAYDLEKVLAPVVSLSSSGDLVAPPKDVRVMCSWLPNSVAVHDIEDPELSHTDFLYGKSADTLVHPILLDYLKIYCELK